MRLASNRGEVVEMIPKITQIDPDSVEQYWCGKCGSSLIWKIQNHPWSYFMASSDYIGGIHLFRFKNIRIDLCTFI